jgi:alkanesulfonate monooxygenase SsuD/methylene tetrahydromethanopterin reductase-like flavin-dependent oxidoreductase (luciferase family)
MDIGLAHFLTDYGMQPAELGRKVEERGFESLMLPEHTHIPVSRDTPYPGGGELPREYSHTLDPFAAKEVASVDQISGGRFLFGVGAGWNREEMENHGTDYRTRFTRMRESVEAIKAIWTEDEAEYHGKIVDFDPIWCWPKPAQKPHPPVLVGGLGEKVLDRVVAYGDEWIPNRVKSPEDLALRIEELQRRAAEAGRDPIPVTVFGAKSEVRLLERLRDAGVTRSLFYLPPGGPGEIEQALDRLAKVAAEWDG